MMVLVCGGLAVADDKKAPAPMAAPKPAKELEAVAGWVKAWTCTGTNGAGEKTTGKLVFKKELDNHWLSIRFETAKTKMMPGFTGQGVFGYDTVSKGWVLTGFDNMGGWINMKSKDASAAAITWEGEAGMGDKKTPAKFLLTNADKKVKFIGEFGGKKMFEHDCK
jgi:hypothetical protein